MANITLCETFLFSSKPGFLSYNFGSRYASRSAKGSEDEDGRSQPSFQKKLR